MKRWRLDGRMRARAATCLRAILVLGLLAETGRAVSTRSFVIDTSEAFEKGTLKGTASYASGKITRAAQAERAALDGVPVAYASAVGPDGAIYVATGNEGAVYRAAGDGVKLFADTPAALVTSLLWVENTLYAGTLPGGVVYAIAADGKVREHAKLAGAEHVWALAYAPKRRTLYAATGPEGKLFAIDPKGQASVVHDDEAEHLLSLDLDAEERIYAGTSNGARLLRLAGGAVQVLYDFPGQEITVLDVGPSFVAVASNEFPPPLVPIGDTKDLGASVRAKRLKPGKGSVFALDFDGRVEELARFDSAHVSALEIEGTDAVQVGLAQDGRIVRLSRSGERALWADVDERQIAAIHLQARPPHFLSSDGVAVYRVRAPDSEGEWTSAVLDAKAPARFGELAVRARGALRLATRSGNTETPDASWSAWSAESASGKVGDADSVPLSAPIKSPPARFLQLRAKVVADAELYALEAYYLPQNLPARVRNVRPKLKRDETNKAHSTQLGLTWDVENPDEDKLRYRVYVRREGHATWQPLLREHELLDQTEYSWETRSVPDGFYRVRVAVTDEPSNPAPYAARAESVSAPVLVDNRAPEILELRYDNGQLSGRAVDALGPITQLEFVIDTGLYEPFFPVDDLLDTRDERFRLDLSQLPSGTHTLAVRATDAAQNVVTAALELDVSAVRRP